GVRIDLARDRGLPRPLDARFAPGHGAARGGVAAGGGPHPAVDPDAPDQPRGIPPRRGQPGPRVERARADRSLAREGVAGGRARVAARRLTLDGPSIEGRSALWRARS